MGTSHDNHTKMESTIRFNATNERRVGATTTMESLDQRTTGRTHVQKSTEDFDLEKIEGGI